MKNTTSIKILIVIQLILMLVFCIIPNVYGNVLNPNDYKPNNIQASEVNALIIKGNVIIGVIQVIGSVIAVIALAIMGIKYMTGSLEEKAEYKKTMIPYIIGATMLFAASNLVQAIYEWSQKIRNI